MCSKIGLPTLRFKIPSCCGGAVDDCPICNTNCSRFVAMGFAGGGVDDEFASSEPSSVLEER